MQDQPAKHSKVSLQGLIQTTVAVIVFLALFSAVSDLVQEKSGAYSVLKSTQATDQRIDVIFAGSSHMNNAIHPMTLWNKYGVTAFNHAQSGQIVPVSYYACKEVIELYKPKVLVLDMYMLYYKRDKAGNATWLHSSLDSLRPSSRLEAVLDLVPEKDREEYLLPFTLYHARWNSLTEHDFNYDKFSLPVDRGCALSFNKAKDIAGMTFEYVPADVKQRPADLPLEYLERIVKLCKDTDTQLMLVTLPYFISSEYKRPSHDMSQDQAWFNWVADFAQENGLHYVNYFHLVDELGFNWTEHLYNYSHMNYWGGEIITDHLVDYIHANYQLEDRRSDPNYQNWHDDYQTYVNEVEEQLAQLASAS